MKQRYNEINHALCVHAALDAYDHKWSRKAFLRDASKYGGVSRIELARDELEGSIGAKIDVAEGVAYEMETRLDSVHITVNKNAIPYDPEKPTVTSGIRIGTPAVTTRGMKEAEMRKIGHLIALCAKDYDNQADAIRAEVQALCKKFPLFV